MPWTRWWSLKAHTLRFVDTAGIRRKGKTHLMAEKMSVVMARRHLEAADVALLVIDATEGVTGADATIGGYAHESGRSVIIIVNKWDAVTTAARTASRRGSRDLRAAVALGAEVPGLCAGDFSFGSRRNGNGTGAERGRQWLPNGESA